MSSWVVQAILLLSIVVLFGCRRAYDRKQQENKLIPSVLKDIVPPRTGKDDSKDILLDITSDKRSDSNHVYVAMGLYKGKTVGLQVTVKSHGPNGVGAEGVNGGGLVQDFVQFVSIGQESDDFVEAMSELYNQPIKSKFTSQKLSVSAFSLNSYPTDLDKKGEYKFKLFFQPDSDSLYGEVFFNINTDKRIIELPEKDFDYRKNVLAAFTRQ
jgi:hypothetical protein